jgi:site-specific DNA-methyltransferase (adenine-specific)
MAHLSENSIRLGVSFPENGLHASQDATPNVEFIILPYFNNLMEIPNKTLLCDELNSFINQTHSKSTIAILTSPILAAEFCTIASPKAHLKLWCAVKLKNLIANYGELTKSHAALLIFTRYKESLNHTKTRIEYAYCPACSRTTKDYGGKKHLYHEYGTLMSDIWRDIEVDFNENLTDVINRLQDLFGLSEYQTVNSHDWRKKYTPNIIAEVCKISNNEIINSIDKSLLLNGDCIEELRELPDNSIEFCFADPPYNIKKKYENWNDGIDIQEYFEWCDKWLSEMARVLKPGCTLAVLNIPQWCIRHFQHLITILDYQDWIVWEGLSLPVRMIMPAHYSILCFTKGKPRQLPGLIRQQHSNLEKSALETLQEGFCIRPNCVAKRKKQKINDTQISSNIWWDIHRLKHNSRRVDHPCQLPPLFMYRLISLFTNEGECVLDLFNGAGTTTLTAQQLNRKYVGIELSKYYHNITSNRHQELESGIDPFRKSDETPKTKNSRVQRLKKQVYEVSKKELQLEVRKIAEQIGRKPTKEDIKERSKYPIEYFENYFTSWGEVTAAARTTGMTEYKNGQHQVDATQLRLFGEPKSLYRSPKNQLIDTE